MGRSSGSCSKNTYRQQTLFDKEEELVAEVIDNTTSRDVPSFPF
ncbi:Uncharacterised protein [Capnocytophaga granulosa]|nr:Uncharacterised protein [Capnocytophaga granulosa]